MIHLSEAIYGDELRLKEEIDDLIASLARVEAGSERAEHLQVALEKARQRLQRLQASFMGR